MISPWSNEKTGTISHSRYPGSKLSAHLNLRVDLLLADKNHDFWIKKLLQICINTLLLFKKPHVT